MRNFLCHKKLFLYDIINNHIRKVHLFYCQKTFPNAKKQPTYIGCSLTKTATFASLSPPPSAPLSLFLRLREKSNLSLQVAFLEKRQRPTFPGGLPPSIISAKELNFCVRYGNRCDLLAIATAYLLSLLYCTLKTE